MELTEESVGVPISGQCNNPVPEQSLKKHLVQRNQSSQRAVLVA